MSDVHDPDIGILDEVVDAVWISRDKPAAQLRCFRVANAEMRSLSNERGRLENRQFHTLGAGRILFGDNSRISLRSSRARGVNRTVMNCGA